jgi:hypothetical protein
LFWFVVATAVAGTLLAPLVFLFEPDAKSRKKEDGDGSRDTNQSHVENTRNNHGLMV